MLEKAHERVVIVVVVVVGGHRVLFGELALERLELVEIKVVGHSANNGGAHSGGGRVVVDAVAEVLATVIVIVIVVIVVFVVFVALVGISISISIVVFLVSNSSNSSTSSLGGGWRAHRRRLRKRRRCTEEVGADDVRQQRLEHSVELCRPQPSSHGAVALPITVAAATAGRPGRVARRRVARR